MPPEDAALGREKIGPSPECSENWPPNILRVADEILTSPREAKIESRQIDNAIAGMGIALNCVFRND